MKSSKPLNVEYKNVDRKNSKKEKPSKLDRKSSRGMIFENEELRLRTININAEVERGQTDIKRLRRENEHLRREIWTLRDECDRLNKRFKAKILDQEHGGCNARGSGGSSGCNRCPSQNNSDDSDSCDTCKGDDVYCTDDCCQQMSTVKQNTTMDCTKPKNNINATYPKFNEPHHLHNTFDHLSVVSEETLSNSEVQAAAHQQNEKHQQEDGRVYTSNMNGSQGTLPNLMGQLTPLTPVDLVANQLNDLQAVVPPLSYFENILQEHMGSTIGVNPDTACISPNSKILAKHTNGWDYNLQSPFAHRKTSITSSTSSPSSASIRSATIKQRCTPTQTTLSTFMPTSLTTPSSIVPSDIDKSINNKAIQSTHADTSKLCTSKIETVAITTMPTTSPPIQSSLGSPKHFFSPLKPRLKINTSLANKNASIPTPPIVPPITAIETSHSQIVSTLIPTSTATKEHQNCDPPDIYVANALASPYKRPTLPSQSPHLPHRTTNSSSTTNVSPRHCQHHRYCHQHQHSHQYQRESQHDVKQHHHHHQQQLQKQHQQQQQQQQQEIDTFQSISPVFVVDVTDSDFDVDTDTDTNTDTDIDINANAGDDNNAATPINIEATSASASATASTDTDTDTNIDTETAIVTDKTATTIIETPTLSTTNTYLQTLLPIEQEQEIVFSAKTKEPIYAIAQERSCNLIPASALTKPLMTATINSPSKISIATIKPTNTTVSALNCISQSFSHSHSQTESVNLETILNDIEHISEDILAIQLEKNKSRENVSSTNAAGNSKSIKAEDKNKKPYRSEMNLLLSYDGTNPTITQTSTKTTSSHSANSENCLRTRARSLERDKTESPSPKVPDAMPAFPDNHTYMGFEQPNKGKTAIALQLQKPSTSPSPHSIRSGSKSATSSPKRLPPPTPPIRMYPPSLNIRYDDISKSAPMVNGTPTTPQVTNDATTATFQMQGLMPNKSHLYKALANAAAKRRQFRLASPTLSRSLDTDAELLTNQDDKKNTTVDATTTNETSSSAEAVTRKARRVSIICGESPQTPDISPTMAMPPIPSTPTKQLSTGSCINLTATPTNPHLQSLKQFTCHSTPNSPHSMRRQNDATSHDELIRNSQIQIQHQHQRSNISNNASQHRRSSQDSTRINTQETMTSMASVNPTAIRSKCSRRFSDGTVASNLQRISGSSGHHHHHHHHHQHSSSTMGNGHHNQHHNRHSHQDSNLETGSVSDRNSNSFSSSRDSSTSFSMRSQRRKISVSSHTGGKIPWCGCWGNGCL